MTKISYNPSTTKKKRYPIKHISRHVAYACVVVTLLEQSNCICQRISLDNYLHCCLFSWIFFWQGIENDIPFGVVATIAEIAKVWTHWNYFNNFATFGCSIAKL